MSRKQRRPKDANEAERSKQIARTVKRRVVALIVFLLFLLVALLLGAGETWLPGWVLGHRRQVEGLLVLAISLLILFSPMIVEASSKPRALSGPGKNPEGPRLG